MPHILDLSVLEGRLPAPRGHTLKDRIKLYRLAKEFGFEELALFSFFDFRNVDVQFLEWFVEKRENMDGVFSTVSTMGMTDGGAAPGASFRTNYGIERHDSVGQGPEGRLPAPRGHAQGPYQALSACKGIWWWCTSIPARAC